MLSRKYRLSASPLVVRVLRRGAAYSSDYWLLKWLPNNLSHPRFAFIVSNKISKRATVRNTIKRRLREAVRRYAISKVPNADIILTAKPSLVNTPYSIISDKLQAELKQYFIIPRRKPLRSPPIRTYRV